MELPTIPPDQLLKSQVDSTPPLVEENQSQTQFNTFQLIGMLVALTLLGLVAYLLYQNRQLHTQLENQKSVSTIPENLITATPISNAPSQDTQSPAVSPTTNLLTYTSARHQVSFEYPPSWSVEEVDGAVPLIKISRENYLINIDFPDGFGPGVCIFSDHPDFTKEIEGPVEKCGKDFVVIPTIQGELRRRLYDVINDTTFGWQILSKNTQSGYFVTVPLISYQTPRYYDEKILKEMDLIIATYKGSKK